MIVINREADKETERYKYFFEENFKFCKKENKYIPLRFDMEGGMIDFWYEDENTWIWDDEATIEFKDWFGQNIGREKPFLTNEEKNILLNILDSERIDSSLGENEYDQDELGLIMAKLGHKEMKDIYQ